jgi:hypothetical protein
MSGAQMEGVRFGELPYIKLDSYVVACNYSPEGRVLAVGVKNGLIDVYKTTAGQGSVSFMDILWTSLIALSHPTINKSYLEARTTPFDYGIVTAAQLWWL